MFDLLIKNGQVINKGETKVMDIAVKNGRIERVGPELIGDSKEEIDATGFFVLPGLIDDQVHFREPGLTHKADIGTESAAAAAGGVTSFMEMPNTHPAATTRALLEEKYAIAGESSIVNYSFYMGTSNDNYEEVIRTNPHDVCGVKIFMGSSTGNMLVDDRKTLERLFSNLEILIATHCEDEATIDRNMRAFAEKFGLENLRADHHPLIRSREGCLLSSSMAVELARKHGTQLHVLHISTAEETRLFESSRNNSNKHITAEACVHHLFFCDEDYELLGNRIKCNPAIKSKSDREEILRAVLDDRIDVIATDHAPHTLEEKNRLYSDSPSGLPLVQHTLDMMWQLHLNGKISKEEIVRKMCHAPAELFKVVDRGFLDEGFKADIVLFDPLEKWEVKPENCLYKCGWSPLEGREFTGRVKRTIVNGNTVYKDGKIKRAGSGERLLFARG
ncbi:MAG: dihydroorotase [Saprospirales bacterium]|nr:MAG: dihydroorotase [Saprospirales bacterium]